MDLTSAAFWAALGSIILTNVVLSGDNAVVIALAARSLPPQQQGKAIFWGSAAAIVLRIVLTLVAVQLLQLPYLKIIGALLLFWIGVQLLLEEEDEVEDGKAPEQKGMFADDEWRICGNGTVQFFHPAFGTGDGIDRRQPTVRHHEDRVLGDRQPAIA